MKYYIGSDLGTSALKLLLVDLEGNVIKEISRSYPVDFPNPGWSEQSPEKWWKAFASGVKELVEGIPSCDIVGIGSGGQMHGLVVLDQYDNVIRFDDTPNLEGRQTNVFKLCC